MQVVMKQAKIVMMTEAINANIFDPGRKLGLFVNNFIPSDTTPFDEFVQPAFVGGGPKLDPVIRPNALLDQDNGVYISMVEQAFVATVVAAPETVYGWYLYTADDQVIVAETFDEPKIINEAGDAVLVPASVVWKFTP